MKTIEIEKNKINVLTKEELLALGYREFEGTMKKEYPADSLFGREVGMVIFYEVPNNAGVYEVANSMLVLFYYKRSWDVEEFLNNAKKAVLEYRTDMEKLGIPESQSEGAAE